MDQSIEKCKNIDKKYENILEKKLQLIYDYNRYLKDEKVVNNNE